MLKKTFANLIIIKTKKKSQKKQEINFLCILDLNYKESKMEKSENLCTVEPHYFGHLQDHLLVFRIPNVMEKTNWDKNVHMVRYQ